MSRESSQKVNSELFSLEPTALLEFFVIHFDYVNTPTDVLNIHGGTNGIQNSIYWQGVEYLPFPIQSSGFESKGDGSLPRPKLMVSNQDFFVSNLIRRYNNLIGAKVVRKRTFVKFLDNRNFSDNKNPYNSADPKAFLEDQVFFILRKSSENRAMVEFELSSPLELENVTFPKRIVMARYCSFHYRGNGCKYEGPPVADDRDNRIRNALNLKSGLIRRYYTGIGALAQQSTSGLTTAIANATFSSESVTSDTDSPIADTFGLEFIGYFKVDTDQAGVYQFGIDADDNADAFINGNLIASIYVDGGQADAPRGFTTTVPLSAGYQRILIRHRENFVGQLVKLYYKTPGTSNWVAVPSSRYYYDPAEQNLLTTSQRFYSTLQLASGISLNKSALMDGLNRGRWANKEAYRVGEYVYIENSNIRLAKNNINEVPNWTPLLKFYVCIKNHTATGANHPAFNKEYWICDQCSKTIDGCRIRFGREGYLPFGGFPGTEEYSINASQ